MSRSRVLGAFRRALARSAAVGFAAVLTVGLTGAAPAAGQQVPLNRLDLADGVTAADWQPDAGAVAKISPRLGLDGGPVTAFVELAEQPAVDAFNARVQTSGRSAARQAARQARNRTDDTATSVFAALRAQDRTARELYRTRNAVPGIAVLADAAELRELAANDDVRSITPMVLHEPTNAGSAALTRAVQAWQRTGRLGDGVRIGIIDTGIDYTHSMFGGTGSRSDFLAVDETVVPAQHYPSEKVAGGWDFVGNGYNAASNNPNVRTPRPDPNPIDCNSHGSHVAGTAAGFGVHADGSTFDGDYRSLTGEDLYDMRIAPGTAPRALLYALKVFGCSGSTGVTAQAIDWALDPDQDGDFTDKLDVINLSLGAAFGAPDDPTGLFIKKVTEQGVLAVLSAGNEHNNYDIGGSPGTTPEGLTVASSRDSFVMLDAVEVTAPAELAGDRKGQYSVNYDYLDGLDLTGPVVAISDAGNLDGCQPFSAADAAAVSGKLVWLEWDNNDATRRCASGVLTNNAQAAGAVGVVLTSSLEQFTGLIGGNAGIPVFQLTASVTDELRPAMEAGTLELRLATEKLLSFPTFVPEIEDTTSVFTSRSVRTSVKPDVAAPGDTVVSALVGSGSLATVKSGTSMAAPHTAGIAALVRQAHPDWRPAEVKAAVMNTANHDVYFGAGQQPPIHAPNRVGAGRIDAEAALDSTVLAAVEDDRGAVSVGFGPVEVAGPTALTKTIRLVNKGARAASFSVGYEPVTELPGVRYELDRSSVTLSPRGVTRVTVTLRVDDPAALRKVADPTVDKLQSGVPRQFLADASGRVVFTPTSGATVPLRVPVYAAPKPVSAMNAAGRIRIPAGSDQGVLNLVGRGINQGAGDQRYRSLVSVFELQANSPRLPDCNDEIVVDCALNETAKGGDLRYVGAASTAPLANEQGNPEQAILAFGMAMWGNWYSVGNNTIPYVDIDTDGNGRPDYEVYVTTLTRTNVLLAVTVDLNQPTFPTVDIQPVNGLWGDVDANVFDTNVIALPVALTALGIDPTADSHRISYQVGVAGRYGASGGLVDSIAGALSFDPLRPGLWVQGGGDPALSYVARPGTALVVNRDQESLGQDGANSLLVVHHHNADGKRAGMVRVTGPPAAAMARPAGR